MAPTLLLGHGQCIIVGIVVSTAISVIIIVVSIKNKDVVSLAISVIIIKNNEAFLLWESVHIKLPVRVTTGAHL